MKSAAKLVRRLMLLVVCHSIAAGQPVDLTPLLPIPEPGTQELRRAVLAGDLARAETLAARLTDKDRVLWRGIVEIVRNEPVKAIRVLSSSGHFKALGVAYYLVRQQVLFRQQMAEAIRVVPGDFGPYYYLGRHYYSDADDAEEAAKWFRLALERKPEYARARYFLGNCLERLRKYSEAEKEYAASLAVPQSLAGIARLRLLAEDGAGALRYTQKAIEADPRDPGIAKLAAKVYGALDRPEDALLALETAARLAPRDSGVQYQLWRAYKARGLAEKGAAALREFERLRVIYGATP